ncbi:hypothetical protein [Legionella micdadei]|uniref:Uncharacterized protein n=1 Tax=Legionella micdadei TaxID=451 RepID=A0A098GGW3_LEGMI|nr:hypothetical protein [Legionella micdadei]ARG96871.1 hypothetical protein B6N58_03870 [Legionella micdadei]ARG99605.1 hypothetical protein B6V88_03785 [Legionella micdadei]KTD26553.1 hypothetical protein Lmic_2647 [Legionella micdadei]NSL17856.1 hypothetical protein [Legionella micdadei]CEG61728.1 protein of unknown function [ankyrin repeat] [Legionella micdadei]
MGKKRTHRDVMAKLREIVGDSDYELFKAKIEEFDLGLDDSSHYNRAIRRLCTSSHPKVILLLEEILPHRLVLNISLTETNKEGLSAFDYAEKFNQEALALLKKHHLSEYNGLINQGASKLAEQLPQYIPVQPNRFFQPTSTPSLTRKQKEFLDTTADKTASSLLEELPGLMDIFSLPPEEAERRVRQATSRLISQVVPEKKADSTSTASTLSLGALIPGLEEKMDNDLAFKPFVELCKEANYEEAIRFVISCKDQHKASQLLDYLFEFQNELSLDVNKMLNEKRQTPLHQAALASNWPVYYLLVGKGANSFQKDSEGMMAQEYRRQRQMHFMSATGENPLNTLLSGVEPIDAEKCIIS